jgi:hypothetical protein
VVAVGAGAGGSVAAGGSLGEGAAADGEGSAEAAGAAAAAVTSTTPVISGWNAHRYANVPGSAKVWLYVPPAEIRSESNEPSSAVTVCGACPTFVHVTVVPAGTWRSAGPKAKSRASTAAVVGASVPGSVVGPGVGVGVGLGVGEGFGVAAGAAPPAALTTTVPVMSAWNAHR